MFLIGNILMNLITALEFPQLQWLLIYGSKHVIYLFSHNFYCNFKTVVSTEIKLIFESLGTFLIRSIWYFVRGCLFFEKVRKVFKNNVQGCSTPLKSEQIKEKQVIDVWLHNWLNIFLNFFVFSLVVSRWSSWLVTNVTWMRREM